MIKVYSLKRCNSCKKSIEWLKIHNLEYEEIDIRKGIIGQEGFKNLLKLTDGGALDIVSTRCEEFNELKIDLDNLRLTEFIDVIDQNRKLLKHPLILSDNCIQIGYNSEQIRCFIPKTIRRGQLNDVKVGKIEK